MKKTILILILVVIGAGFYLALKNDRVSVPSENLWENGTGESLSIPSAFDESNSKLYLDENYRFSFRYPEHLSITNFKDTGVGYTVLVQSTEKAEGFQILITPFDEGSTLTTGMIKRDIPDLAVVDPQDVLLGESGKGVAFLSDNENFGGNSREVWFIFRGNLYQISTYARLDPLLQAVLTTWKFE